MLLLASLALQVPARPIELELYRAQMAAAESAIRLGEFADARGWLEAVAPEVRGFEWRADHASLDESLSELTTEHAYVSAIAVSPDGSLWALGGRRKAAADASKAAFIELRDAESGAIVAAFDAHADHIASLEFDALGERLVSASHDRTAKVWNVATRELAATFEVHGNPVCGAAFSPDGARVASCSYERTPERGVIGTLHVWNAADGALVRTMEGGVKPLVGVAWSPDGARIAAGSWDFCVFVWAAEGGAPVKCAVPDEGVYNAVDDVVWTRDGLRVAGASKDRTARVFDAATGALVATLRGHTDAVTKLAVSPDGATLATASADGTLRLWNARDGSLRETLRGHADNVVAFAFAPDGQRIVSSSLDRTLRVWDAATDAYGGSGFETAKASYVSAFSPDDARIAVASYDGRVDVRDASTLESLGSWQAHPAGNSCHALAWTPDGARLVTGSWEPVVRVLDAATGAELAALAQPAGTYWLAVSPDGKLAAACAGKAVLVWNLDDYTLAGTFDGHRSTVLAVDFSTDSAWCVSAARDGKAIVFDPRTAEIRCEIAAASADVAEAKFTPDGEHVVVAGRDGRIDLHRAADGSRVRELARLRHGVSHIDVSPDGERLAVASEVTVLVDLAHGGVVGELRRHVDSPYHVDFDSTGTRLVSCSTDKTVKIVDTTPLRERLAR